MIRTPSRRFFPKEVAVLFSLFILNAVLMFVVGLSVGKSWQTKPTVGSVHSAQPEVKKNDPTFTSHAAMGVAPTKPLISSRNETNAILIKPELRAPLAGAIKGAPAKEKELANITSFPQGAYTVQVGSYLSEPEANERIRQLQQFGFPHAYFSPKELGDPKLIWYRVWLGYFSTSESARRGGEWLQKRGEVKSYLVRKNEPNNTTN